jgi:hypothetical protein
MLAPVASLKIMGQRPGGTPFEIHFEVGAPRQVGSEPEEWACSVEVRPLDGGRFEPHGASSLQAMSLALQRGVRFLEDFATEGGLLFYEPGSPFELGPYLVTLRKPHGDA